MRTRILVGVTVLMVVAAACGDGATTTTTTEPAASTTTSVATTTTIGSTTSTQPATSTSTVASTTATTTAEPSGITVEAVVGDVEAWLAADYASSEPPEGVLGPSAVLCEETGSIPVGGVLACQLEPDTAPDFQLDEGGIVIYVLDTDGHAAWSPGTDVPDSAAGLADALAFVGTDLMCRDLMDPDLTTGIFGGVGRPADSAYFWSLVYWSLTGEPDRMDADLNGIPCETVHDASVISTVLTGGPVR